MHEPSFAFVGSSPRTFPISLGGRPIADPSEGLKFLAEPRPGGDPIKAAIDRATKRVVAFHAKFHYWRAYDIWFRKARRVEDYEVQAIIRAAEAKETKELRNEFAEIRNRILILEARLSAQDADFHGPSIEGLGEMTRQFGGKGRP